MKSILTIILVLTINLIYAQPDLVCSNIDFTQKSASLGNNIYGSFKIKNIGNQYAGLTHTAIYVTDSATGFTFKLSEISTETLQPNTETKSYYFTHPLPYIAKNGYSYLQITANCRNEIVESDTFNNSGFSYNNVAINQINDGGQNLPYPVILIHGLCGNDTTWYPFLIDETSKLGYSYGGNLDFCLNEDNNINSSYLWSDFKDFTDTSFMSPGDFYTINFDIDPYGNKYSVSTQSNQSAIVKQGVAVQRAIKHVLDITGKDKVILVGHSMGGLAAREYLQNPTNWQTDGHHHVAKLYTLGTPHGGSNSTSGNLTSIFNNVDERSEAVRDLRRTYDISGDSGVYLYGGLESQSVMNNSLIESYFNVDVNCNGFQGNSIIGLNQKNIPNDLAYTCIIGNDTYFPGLCSNCDGVVNFASANLNNFYNVNADTFYCTGVGAPILFGGKPWHVELPKQSKYVLLGLDEPDVKELAYKIDLDKDYYGLLTHKNAVSNSIVDSDYYKFNIPCSGNITAFIKNIPTFFTGINIFDSASGVNKINYNSFGAGYVEKSFQNIDPGTYYTNISSYADDYSWKNPYALRIGFKPDIIFSGYISTPLHKIINKVSINLKGDSISTFNTDSSGSFRYDLNRIGNYLIKPYKNNDINKANGVTVLDAILVQSHILGKALLNSPYKIIAADVDNSGSVTVLDIIYMKRLILGIDTTFKGNRLWTFVDSGYKFLNPANPFPYKDTISYVNLKQSKLNQGFIGMKLGDVNWDWNSTVAGISTTINKPIELYYNNINTTFEANEIRVPIRVKNFKEILGMQYTLNYNKELLELKSIQNNPLNIEYGINHTNEGKVSFIWTEPKLVSTSLNDGDTLMELVFSKKGTIVSEDVTISNDIAPIEAWDANYQKHNIVKGSGTIVGKPIVESKTQFKIMPNPANDKVVILGNHILSVQVLDNMGRVARILSLKDATNPIFNINNLAKGVYHLRIQTIEGTINGANLVVSY